MTQTERLTFEESKDFPVPWGSVGYLTYKRTYARRLTEKKDSNTEEFYQTVNRIIKACKNQLKVGFTDDEENELRYLLMSLKAFVAGRFMWQLGTKTVSNLGLASLQNCAFTNVNDPIRPFVWAMDSLMLGAGVGYNIQRENVYQLPKIRKKKISIIRQDDASADYIVPDTREGWVKLLGKVLKAHFFSGEGFTYSTQLIRGKDAVISAFGGLASGPEILVEGMTLISDILNSQRGKRLRPIHCLDIMNIIGMLVVSGNVRRSAQLAIGDSDDLEFLRAKRWDLGSIPKWRSYSNNSVVCSDTKNLPDEFWHGYSGNGEAYGLINLDLARSCGRLGEDQYFDPEIEGFNPCAEQGLADKETCCLAEFPLPLMESKEELQRVLYFLYRICKHSLMLKSHHPETEVIVHKNMRMGIGLTGDAMSTKEQQSWLSDSYIYLRELDVKYSQSIGMPQSIKLTTLKPSGTLSLLPGVTSGCHDAIFPYFIRRILISAGSPLLKIISKHNFPLEYRRNSDGSQDHSSFVVSFPGKYPHYSRFVKDRTAIQQLNRVKDLQTIWSDNSVSVTIYYKLEELPEIRQWLDDNYATSLKTISFMLHKDHGFDQAPFEEITKDQYLKMIKDTTPIIAIDFDDNELDLSNECSNGSCPIR